MSSIVREDKRRPQFLYLDTIGWKTTNRHRIEIWFVEHDKRYYILSERKKRAHWVQNILRNPKILFTVNNKNFDGYARVIDDKELELISNVSRLMNNKYGWSDGLIIELNPQYSKKILSLPAIVPIPSPLIFLFWFYKCFYIYKIR